MLNYVAVLSPGIFATILVLLGRKQHLAKYGSAPPGHHWVTFLFFVMWSLLFVLVESRFPGAVFGITVLVAIVVYVDSETFDLIRFGWMFRRMGWSRRQQLRDGYALALMFVYPVVLMFSSART